MLLIAGVVCFLCQAVITGISISLKDDLKLVLVIAAYIVPGVIFGVFAIPSALLSKRLIAQVDERMKGMFREAPDWMPFFVVSASDLVPTWSAPLAALSITAFVFAVITDAGASAMMGHAIANLNENENRDNHAALVVLLVLYIVMMVASIFGLIAAIQLPIFSLWLGGKCCDCCYPGMVTQKCSFTGRFLMVMKSREMVANPMVIAFTMGTMQASMSTLTLAQLEQLSEMLLSRGTFYGLEQAVPAETLLIAVNTIIQQKRQLGIGASSIGKGPGFAA